MKSDPETSSAVLSAQIRIVRRLHRALEDSSQRVARHGCLHKVFLFDAARTTGVCVLHDVVGHLLGTQLIFGGQRSDMQVMNGRYHFQQICSRYVSRMIGVIEAEQPLELLVKASLQLSAQRRQKLAKINETLVFLIERPEHKLGELFRVSVRERFSIKFFELIRGHLQIGAVVAELTVQVVDLGVREGCHAFQLFDQLWWKTG